MTSRKSQVREMLRVFVLLSTLAAPSAQAERFSDPQAQTAYDLFWRLSRVRRQAFPVYTPATPTDPVNGFLKMVVAESAPKWTGEKPTILFDAYGNARIVIPATGRWIGNPRSISIQAHTDIVENVSPELAGRDFAEVFANGVELEVEGDWLVSRGKRTTIGADNGLGVVTGLSFLFHPELEHARLTIDLTRDEESDLFGVESFAHDFGWTRAQINLDSPYSDRIAIGCSGFLQTGAQFEQKVTPVSGNFRVLELKFAGLTGGHSGLDIIQNRGNANRLAWEFLHGLELRKTVLLSFNAGVGASSIPPEFSMKLAVPEGDVSHLQKAFGEAFSSAAIRRFTDEDPKSSPMGAIHLKPVVNVVTGLNMRQIRRLAAFFLDEVPEGALKKVPGEHYQHDMETSASTGVVRVGLAPGGGEMKVEFVSLIRSHIASEQDRVFEEMKASVRRARWRNVVLAPTVRSAPWAVSPKHWLVREALAVFPEGTRLVRVAGTSETAYFHRRFPGFGKIDLGFDIENEHGPLERTRLSTFPLVIEKTRRLVRRVGTTREFASDECRDKVLKGK